MQGGETILFKASQGNFLLEGVVEALLKNKEDADKLARRSENWGKKRSKLGYGS